MKIAMIGLRGLPASYGGVEKHVEEIGWRLAADGHQVTVYCRPTYSTGDLVVPAGYNYEPPRGRRPGSYRGVVLRNLPTPGGKHLESTVHSGLSAVHTLRRNYDIVHFHAMGPGLFTPIPKLLSRAAVVQTIHGLDDERAKWSFPARSMLRLGRTFSTFVPDEVIVVSRELARVYEELHGRAATYIPNGAPKVTPVPAGATLDRFGLRPGYVLFLGRLVPEKQPDMLLRAFAQVPGRTQLAIVGDSSHTDAYADELRALAAADPRVVLTGYLYGEALAEVMSLGRRVRPAVQAGGYADHPAGGGGIRAAGGRQRHRPPPGGDRRERARPAHVPVGLRAAADCRLDGGDRRPGGRSRQRRRPARAGPPQLRLGRGHRAPVVGLPA